MTAGEYRKVGFIKVGEKTSAISETSTFSTWPGDGDGNDRVNVTRYEHDVDNVNDDDFYILNKNDLMIQARHVQLKNISQP